MTILWGDNARMAMSAIRGNKTRSILTMLGIIIGVSSVIMTVSLGEGIRRQVADTNQVTNDRLITVRSGRIAQRGPTGQITDVNYLAALGVNTLTEKDYEALQRLEGASVVVPLGTISGLPTNFEGATYDNATIIASNRYLPDVLNQKVLYGSFFTENTGGRGAVVIGKRVAEELFNENVPIGKLLTIRGQDFVVGGVFDEFKLNPLSTVTDLNRAIFISYDAAKTLSGNPPSLYQLMLLPKDGVETSELASAVHNQLLASHGQQEDFTVLKGAEIELVTRRTINVATSFVAGIAAISLLVGGIGIMNIMFVSVTERTREIGVRKSLGATNRQIYSQYLIEATVLSLVGGTVGIILSLLGNIALRVTSDLEPAATWQIIVLAAGVSAAVGIIFGTIPAVKAARKDPIESLRYE